MFTQVEATAISVKPKLWDKAYNTEKLESFFVDAARRDKPDLILATEAVLEGYLIMEVIDDLDKAQAMIDIAEPIDGPTIKRFRKLAKKLQTCLCFGFAERIRDEAYNTAIFIDHQGEISGKYHKTQFYEGTHPTWNFNRIGRTIRAFDTPHGRAGFLICNDRWNPMIARTLVLDGARLLLIPSYGENGKAQNQTVLARARENGVPIVEANQGMNMIISQGEMVAYKWGHDQITTAVIEVPENASTRAARDYEKEYMNLQGPNMEKNYRRTMRAERSRKKEQGKKKKR